MVATPLTRVLTRIFENRIHRIHPWKKVGVKIEKLEFDLEKLEFLVLTEI